MNKTLSLDLRTRILDSYDKQEGTRLDIAQRFRVSLGMVKKLIQQRSKTGDIVARHRHSGRKPKLLDTHRRQLRELLSTRPDMTLAELREALKLDCTLPAIHYVLLSLNLTYKKRHSMLVNKTAPTSRSPAKRGAARRVR